MTNRTDELEDFIFSIILGSIIVSFFTQYAALYPDHLNQFVEVFIEIGIEGAYLIAVYGLSGIWYYSENQCSHSQFFEECGGYAVITAILILVLMSLGSIFTAAKHQPLFY